MRYLPNSPAEREKMLAEIGAASIDDLFAVIPAEHRLNRDLDVPRAYAESEIIDYFRAAADKNATGLPPAQYRRCWPYHLAMKPFYHLTPQIWNERATYWLVPLYERWLRRRLRSPLCPKFDVAQGLMGFATELFARAMTLYRGEGVAIPIASSIVARRTKTLGTPTRLAVEYTELLRLPMPCEFRPTIGR